MSEAKSGTDRATCPACRLRSCGLQTSHASSFSRGIALRGLSIFPSHHARERSADRRSGWIATPSRASDAGPQARNVAPRVPSQTSSRSSRIRGTLASRRSTRRFFGPEPAAVKPLSVAQRGDARRSHVAHSRVPLVVAGGRCCRAPPGCWLRANAQDAGPTLLMPSRRAPKRADGHDDAIEINAVKLNGPQLFIAW